MSALPLLNRALLDAPELRDRPDPDVPPVELLALPERAVQFGTGAFLRGFVDYFIDAANRSGRFNGRIVAIGSTASGRDQLIAEQDGLFTLAIAGLADGEPRWENRIVASVSRALPAERWNDVLECARNPDLELIFSNTTEIGIALDEGDDGMIVPPRSFPGKLTRFLHERALAFDYDPARGVVVIPCELVERNGDRLRDIVMTLAARWSLGERFTRWLHDAVPFCNTLVDRIVPGTPNSDRRHELERQLGYRDDLLTACEVYRLFAIEGDAALARRLSFAPADPGVVITSELAPYHERKVRLLNGAHTLMAPLALLAGCSTVLEAMEHELVGRFVRRAMLDEIAPGLDAPGAGAYAAEVLERLANPYVQHALIDITLHATMKMQLRVVPSIVRYSLRTGRAPTSLAFGFAAHLLFMRGHFQKERRRRNLHVPPDGHASRLADAWTVADRTIGALVQAICSDSELWGRDLTAVPGFVGMVTDHLVSLERLGIAKALESHLSPDAQGRSGPTRHHQLLNRAT